MAAGQPTPVTLHWAQYDGLGNICAKRIEGAGLGYIYAGRAGCGVTTANGGGTSATVGAHRVASVGDGVRTYAYDARGNQTFRNMPGTASDRTIAYSLDDKAHEVDVGGNKTRYWYGSDGQRYKREDTGRKILYLGNVEVEIAGSTTTIRRTVAGVMIQTIVGSTATNHYQFHDVLGSLIRTTNAAGTAIDNLDYKAFGLRVSYSDPQTVSYTGSSISLRGFTGHEHIDKVDMDVIHMNGRIYDPELGRFLQADPVIQAPGNLQSWNAYTYVFNNPLAYTDPTGLFSLRKALGIVIVVVAAVTQQHWAISAATKFWGTVGFGALAGGVSTGSWQGAVWGAISAAAFYGVGSYFENLSNLNDWAGVETVGNTGLTLSELGFKTLSHGAIGGVMSKLQGGKFGNGFASAGVTEAFAPAIAKAGNPGGRVIVASIVGGTASEISGGKFANGAVTAAFGHAFNELLHYVKTDDGQMTVESPGKSIDFGTEEALSIGGFIPGVDLAVCYFGECESVGWVLAGMGAVPGGGKVAGFGMKGTIWSATKVRSSVDNAFLHWKKHASKFPEYINAKQYVDAARAIAASPPTGTLMKSRGTDTLMYHPKTNTFLVRAANGAPRTMFRPDDGIEYWNKL